MAGWRTLKRAALADIHRTFEIPAVYLTHAAGTPIPVMVRLHRRQIVVSQEVGDWSHAASDLETADRIIFSEAELPAVLNNSFVIFGNSEAYLTGPSKPEREGYIWVECTEVSQGDLSTLLASQNLTLDAWKTVFP